MLTDDCYIQAQINLLEITMALAGEVPKRSGDFETTYKNESGKEIVVKRSPDGKFANKNGGATSQETTTTVNVGKSFGTAIGASVDEIAKMPAKVQDAVRKAMFDSDFSRAIDKGAEKFIKSAYDPGLEAGFKLGQSIKAELAKKTFSKFAETVTAKFEEFRKDLPQKSDDLRKEIIRIAKDPNTSATVAAGALMALAGNFYIASFFCAYRAAGVTLWLLKRPKATAIASTLEGKFGAVIGETVIPGLSKAEALVIAKAQLLTARILGSVVIGGEMLGGLLYSAVGGILTSLAGRAIMNRAKANAQVENDRLKQEILAKKEDSDALYQQQLDQQAKDAETRRKILEELSKGAPKSPADLNPDKPETLAGLPVINVKLTDTEEEFAADPKRREQILAKAYKDKEFLKLSFAYMEAQALALVAALSDKQSGKEFAEIAERAHAAINDRLAVVIKAEINRLQQLEKQ